MDSSGNGDNDWPAVVRTIVIATLVGAGLFTGRIPWEPGLGALSMLAFPGVYRKLRGHK